MSAQDSGKQKELDLRDIIAALIRRRLVLIGSIVIALVIGIIYCSSARKVYIGKGLVEIGEIVFKGQENENLVMLVQPLERVGDLAEFISHLKYNDTRKDESFLQLELARGSTKIVSIKYENEDPSIIKDRIQNIIQIILDRHKRKMDFYSKSGATVQPSEAVGEIVVGANPLRPNIKSVLTGSVLAGFLLGLLFIFIIEFVAMSERK